MKKENEILKHELKITNLKLSIKDDDSKIESDLKSENVDLRSNLTKLTSELETTKLQYAELEKYNAILKGELKKCWAKKIEDSIEKTRRRFFGRQNQPSE